MANLKSGDPGKPRLELGQWLRRRNQATAMIDISDGLSTDLTHICTESRVSARLFRESIPFDRSRKRTIEERFEEDTRRYAYAMYGGEDYELLFTAPRGKPVPGKIAGTQITKIGEVLARKPGAAPITIVHGDGRVEALSTAGWEHFSSFGTADR
jgi:thiamine-monophosphate kinase